MYLKAPTWLAIVWSVAVITASGLEQICYDADLSVLVRRPMV